MAPGTLLAGRYRIVAPIGRGGMGQVYRAEDLRLGETVALKFLPESLANDPAWLGRFYSEVRTAREVTHPNVCRVHDLVETEDAAGRHICFLTMEYVDGENLADLIRRFGRLPTEKGMEIAAQITAALAAAHQKGVLHRDIKPANVLIDGRGQAKLADFGLAIAGDAARAGEVAGTPGYIAPEVLKLGLATGKSDLYSLGVVLYELLTGKRAFKDGRLTTAGVRHYAPEVPIAAEKIIEQSMDPDPARRPVSIVELQTAFPAQDALQAALARGETPSPEMVAASGDEQPLALWKAWALVGATIAFMLSIWLISPKGSFLGTAPPQLSAEEMRGRAQQYLRDFGYSTSHIVQVSYLDINDELLDWVSQVGTRAQKQNLANAVQGSLALTYRQSADQNLLPSNGVPLNPDDPSPLLPSMQFAEVDSDGHLTHFLANPVGGGESEESPLGLQSAPTEKEAHPEGMDTESTVTGTADWAPVIAATGLDPSTLQPDKATFVPPFAFNQIRAWKASYPGHAETQVRLEVAAWQGKLVYLHVVGPWDDLPDQFTIVRYTRGIFLFMTGAALLIGAWLAMHNLRRKRGDVRSATRLALFSLALSVGTFLLGLPFASRSMGDYFQSFLNCMAGALLIAGGLWLTYVAIEPLTRRRIPSLLVASSLILQGKWKKPRVGKEILLGTAVGVMLEVYFYICHTIEWRLLPGGTLNVPDRVRAMLGFREFLASILAESTNQLVYVATLAVLFLVFLLLVRRRWVAAIITVLFIIAQGSTRGALVPALVVLAGLAIAETILLVRVGLIAAITAAFVNTIADNAPWPHDLGNWMSTSMVLTVLTVLAVAGSGFWLAIGDQRMFGTMRFDD
jgi:serine/threonine-protein kinase